MSVFRKCATMRYRTTGQTKGRVGQARKIVKICKLFIAGQQTLDVCNEDFFCLSGVLGYSQNFGRLIKILRCN